MPLPLAPVTRDQDQDITLMFLLTPLSQFLQINNNSSSSSGSGSGSNINIYLRLSQDRAEGLLCSCLPTIQQSSSNNINSSTSSPILCSFRTAIRDISAIAAYPWCPSDVVESYPRCTHITAPKHIRAIHFSQATPSNFPSSHCPHTESLSLLSRFTSGGSSGVNEPPLPLHDSMHECTAVGIRPAKHCSSVCSRTLQQSTTRAHAGSSVSGAGNNFRMGS
jgi:hypothetical protein